VKRRIPGLLRPLVDRVADGGPSRQPRDRDDRDTGPDGQPDPSDGYAGLDDIFAPRDDHPDDGFEARADHGVDDEVDEGLNQDTDDQSAADVREQDHDRHDRDDPDHRDDADDPDDRDDRDDTDHTDDRDDDPDDGPDDDDRAHPADDGDPDGPSDDVRGRGLAAWRPGAYGALQPVGRLDADDEDAYDPSEFDEGPDNRSRGPIPMRDIALVVSLVVVVILTAVLVRSALRQPAATTADQPVRSSPVPAPPEEAPKVGSYVESRVAADGDVQVQQWVRSSTPLFAVRLEVPAVPGRRLPTASRVTVLGDQDILNPPTSVGVTGHRLFFNAPPRVVYVKYTLQGAIERSPSVPGRALVRATALQIVYSPLDGPSRVSLAAKKVLSMACQSSPLEAPRPCGGPGKGHWSVLLKGDARDDSVVAQVNVR
jgi:hypothetical protein